MLASPILQSIASSRSRKYSGNINFYEKHWAKIQNLTGCYYVLSYYVDEKWDGKYHEIKVEVNRPGCVVHTQKGYFNPKPFREYSEPEKDAFHLKKPPAVYSFDTTEYSPVIDDLEQGKKSLHAMVRCSIFGIEKP